MHAIACGGVCLHCRICVAHLYCPEVGGKRKQLEGRDNVQDPPERNISRLTRLRQTVQVCPRSWLQADLSMSYGLWVRVAIPS